MASLNSACSLSTFFGRRRIPVVIGIANVATLDSKRLGVITVVLSARVFKVGAYVPLSESVPVGTYPSCYIIHRMIARRRPSPYSVALSDWHSYRHLATVSLDMSVPDCDNLKTLGYVHLSGCSIVISLNLSACSGSGIATFPLSQLTVRSLLPSRKWSDP
jgi:hypothetical protein